MKEITEYTGESQVKQGRPSIYNEETAKELIDRMSQGESLRSITSDDHMPCNATIYSWLQNPDFQDFLEQYERAMVVRAHNLFEEALEIADNAPNVIHGNDKSDNARVSAEQLKVDTRKWFLSKLMPKKYGDKLDVTSDGKPIEGNAITVINAKDNESQPDSE